MPVSITVPGRLARPVPLGFAFLSWKEDRRIV